MALLPPDASTTAPDANLSEYRVQYVSTKGTYGEFTVIATSYTAAVEWGLRNIQGLQHHQILGVRWEEPVYV